MYHLSRKRHTAKKTLAAADFAPEFGHHLFQSGINVYLGTMYFLAGSRALIGF